jgi:hypothetical protein
VSEIVTATEAGRHNADLHSATSRIIEGSTWKKTRVIVMIPSANAIPAKIALALWNLSFPANQGVFRMLLLGQEVGEAYSNGIQQVLDHPELREFEYLVTVEHDNMPPPDGILKLIKRIENHPEMAAISGLYWTKGEAGVPQIWGDINDPVMNFRPQAPKPGELVECWGLGMGFCIYRLSMFKDPKIEKPWFKTVQDHTGTGSQDLVFWGKARGAGYRCGVDCDVLVGHYDQIKDIVW